MASTRNETFTGDQFAMCRRSKVRRRAQIATVKAPSIRVKMTSHRCQRDTGCDGGARKAENVSARRRTTPSVLISRGHRIARGGPGIIQRQQSIRGPHRAPCRQCRPPSLQYGMMNENRFKAGKSQHEQTSSRAAVSTIQEGDSIKFTAGNS